MKKIISYLLCGIIIGICGFLFIININHILYLRQYEEYNFNNDYISNIKKEITDISNNISNIDKLDNSFYSQEDLNYIKSNLHGLMESFNNVTILKYEGIKRLYLKDLLAIDLSLPSKYGIINTYNTLVKYDSEMNTYCDKYKMDFVSDAFNNNMLYIEPYRAYIYQFPSNNYDAIIIPLQYRVNSRVYLLGNIVKDAHLLTEQILTIGGINNE